VYHGQRMAELLEAQDGFATKETLQRWCDILNIDFIMLFDAEGNETLCNKDYSGFTLNRGLGSDSSDFRRLLLGIPSIIHETSTDATTGLERQIIGVTLPLADDAHGALIMALVPGQIRSIGGSPDINVQLAAMTTEDARCFIVDEASNVVVYSSDPALFGAKILERGLTEKSLRDGYMDFGTVDDDDNFILTARDESSIFYYTIKCRALLRSVLKYGLFAAVLYLIGVVVLLLILFRGYTQEAYEGIATVKDPDDGISSRRYEDLEAGDDDEGSETVRTLKIHLRQTAGKRLEDKARNSKLKDTLQKLRKKVKWDEQGPEGKAAIVFRAGLTLLLIGWGDLIVRSNLTSKGYGTMANFLLHGDWVKGVNLFSVCSVILIISLAYLVNVISALVLKLLSTFLLGKGQTLCKLIHNAIKYLSVFVSVYFMLQYFGFPIGTVIGSIGIVSLALSLGARDMAADVLAGLSIVFEKSFEVGDIVQIGNAKGVVQEIGVRSTKLLTMDNNLMTISNHSIDTIVNNTRKFSWYTLSFKISIDSPLEEIEAMLNRELPEISNRCDRIAGELRYCGVESFGSEMNQGTQTITLLIEGQCNERDLEDVNLYVNRELLLLLRREGIDIR
jgi:small conductance mechanosensitive channel